MIDAIAPATFHEQEGAADWRVVEDGATAFFRTASFAESAELVAAVARIPGLEAHAPDADIRPDGVTFRTLTRTNDWWGPTQQDLDVARQVSSVAREQGVTADPTQVHSMLIVIEALVTAEVLPFWRAVLGYANRPDSPDEDLIDLHRRTPSIWFEVPDETRPLRNGIHLAIWVPVDEAESRVAAAVAAGGRIIFDKLAPMWWTLADPAGNEVDVATVANRG
jgi:4a-hydroxytetrahydrobiopterin dehydratase